VLFGGVGAEGVLGVGSLILMPFVFLPMTFLALGGGAWAVAALRLPAHVCEEPAPRLLDAALTESTFRARAETRIVGIGDPPSKAGT
jgi:hypothetical protein